MLTGTEQGALRRKAIAVQVHSARGEQVRVEAAMVVDGFPEDFFFRLGPRTEKLRGGQAVVRLGLSPRKREVLDFAIKSCRGTTLAISAKVGKGSANLDADLRRPREC